MLQVYMADATSVILVWDGFRVSRIESSAFSPVKEASEFTLENSTVELDAGVVGMDISPRLYHGEPRFLYFRPMSSYDLHYANTEDLKRVNYGETFNIFGARNVLSSQGLTQAFSADGTLFMGMTKETGIACWNRYNDLSFENIVHILKLFSFKTVRWSGLVKCLQCL